MERYDFDKMELNDVAALAAGGNVSAIEFIVNSLRGTIKQKARSFYVSGADSDDLVQEGMIGLIKAIRDYSPDKNASFRTFADICITRQIFTAIKASRCKKHIPLNYYVSLYNTVGDNDGSEHYLVDELDADEATDPIENMALKEEFDSFSAALSQRLSPLENQVLEKYLLGMNYKEIAKELQRSEKSIDNALQRIKQKASVVLEEGGKV
ncbi:MAG: RNA polymerase sporulation sigma factor SigH [Clostridiales bacterium]|nr:RNA polymerase sporulation sigma factor SigH [Clostridiales bacterium]